MNLSKTASAAALVAMMVATPAFAQVAIQEPGPFGYSSAYDSYAYMGPAYPVRHGRTISRGAVTPTDEVFPAYDWYGRVCIPAPRVGAFATQPWDTQPPCEPSY